MSFKHQGSHCASTREVTVHKPNSKQVTVQSSQVNDLSYIQASRIPGDPRCLIKNQLMFTVASSEHWSLLNHALLPFVTQWNQKRKSNIECTWNRFYWGFASHNHKVIHILSRNLQYKITKHVSVSAPCAPCANHQWYISISINSLKCKYTIIHISLSMCSIN